MHYVYILYSLKIDKFYIGESADIETRLLQHNSGFFKGGYTSRSNDWEIKVVIPFHTSSNAKKAESFIKKMNSRRFVEALISDHQWLIDKFNV